MVEDWADRAAVGHLLSWRLNDYQPVERSAEDMVFSGGKDATIWICDRLARTYLGEWKASSLHWELAYRHAHGGRNLGWSEPCHPRRTDRHRGHGDAGTAQAIDPARAPR